jgi:hypothetical protein
MADKSRLNPSTMLRLRVALLGALLAAVPPATHAANNCPWINEATASGLLGADAVGSFTDATAAQPAVCTFIQEELGTTRTLRITVMDTPEFRALLDSETKACATPASPLIALGNEAIACSGDDRKKLYAERVVGRVRNQVFTITLSTTRKDDSILTRSELKLRILVAAEQVSGNLF